MASLIYSMITSLDGYIADENGDFDWAAPDEEVHAFINDLERPIGTYLYGRRMYEIMTYWEEAGHAPEDLEVERDFAAIWRAANKIVFSTTLAAPTTPRTRLLRQFDPAVVAQLKLDAARDVGIGGPGLAAHALRAGLVDELHVVVTPHVIGGGVPWLPEGIRMPLELVDERRFASGMAYLRYRVG